MQSIVVKEENEMFDSERRRNAYKNAIEAMKERKRRLQFNLFFNANFYDNSDFVINFWERNSYYKKHNGKKYHYVFLL